MLLRDKSHHLIAVVGLALVASASSCETPGEDIEAVKAALVSQPCLQSQPAPAGTFMSTPCTTSGSGNLTITTCTCYPRSPTNPVQKVDWSTRAKMGTDSDSNGIIDLTPPGTLPAPTTITLDLSSCNGQRAPTNTWLVTNTTGFSKTVNAGVSCSSSVNLPSQGDFQVKLTARYDNQTKTTTSNIVVRDYVILSLGDSLASGEGVPDVSAIPGPIYPVGTPAKWENSTCHRSAKSGPAQAALALEQADKTSTVTFISAACSGAGVGTGLQEPFKGFAAQLSAAARVLCPSFTLPTDGKIANFVNPVRSQCRPVDALILNIGANDVGFTAIAEGCVAPSTACIDKLINGKTLQQVVTENLAALPGKLGALQTTINNMLRVNTVLLPEYHDFFADQTGKLCTQIVLPNAVRDHSGAGEHWLDDGITLFSLGFSGLPDDGLIDSRELPFLHDNLFIPFNNKLKETVQPLGWNFVSGIAEEFVTHGYCSTSPWVVKYEQSKATQLDGAGTFHPNAAGHQTYKRHIFQSLLGRLSGAPTYGRKVIADMNGDGRSDLPISSGVGWGSIPVGLSRGDGFFDVVNQGFTSGDGQVPLYATQNGAKPVVGDFNGDGFGDVAFTGGIGWGSLPIAFSNGNGTFNGLNAVFTAAAPNFPSIASSFGAQPVAGDFDGNGKTDIAVMGTGIAEIYVANLTVDKKWQVTGQGLTSGPPLSVHSSAKFARIVAGDFDGNGKSDIAMVTTTATKIPVAFSNGNGTFRSTVGGIASGSEQGFTAFLTADGAELVAGDFNGDGRTDLAFVGGTGWTTIPVALSIGDGSFRFIQMAFEDDPSFTSLANEHGAKPAVGDFNGDGFDDIALTGGTSWSNVPIAFSTGGAFRLTFLGVATGDTLFTTYASQTGATPSTYYRLHHVVKTHQAFYDTTTVCNVGGTWMHCCPTGSAIVGMDLAEDKFKCAPLTNPSGALTLDLGTVRNNMHVCPFGQVMVGLHLALNRLACQAVVGTYPVTAENTDAFWRDPSGMHVCNDVRFAAMSGIRGDQDIYTCTVGN